MKVFDLFKAARAAAAAGLFMTQAAEARPAAFTLSCAGI
jgi:hypothetical protein